MHKLHEKPVITFLKGRRTFKMENYLSPRLDCSNNGMRKTGNRKIISARAAE
jgi:hypothetical protein